MIRSKNFRFGFIKDVGEFVMLRGDVGKIKSFHKMCRAYLDI